MGWGQLNDIVLKKSGENRRFLCLLLRHFISKVQQRDDEHRPRLNLCHVYMLDLMRSNIDFFAPFLQGFLDFHKSSDFQKSPEKRNTFLFLSFRTSVEVRFCIKPFGMKKTKAKIKY